MYFTLALILRMVKELEVQSKRRVFLQWTDIFIVALAILPAKIAFSIEYNYGVFDQDADEYLVLNLKHVKYVFLPKLIVSVCCSTINLYVFYKLYTSFMRTKPRITIHC